MQLKIRVPATSANLGSGFDSMGLAVSLYNYVWMEEAEDKAARYIGGEVNSVMKNLDGIDVRVAFCFPDVCEMLFPSKRIYIIWCYVVSSST